MAFGKTVETVPTDRENTVVARDAAKDARSVGETFHHFGRVRPSQVDIPHHVQQSSRYKRQDRILSHYVGMAETT